MIWKWSLCLDFNLISCGFNSGIQLCIIEYVGNKHAFSFCVNTNIGQKIKRVTKSSYNNTLVRHIGLLEVPKLERLGEVLKEVV